MVIMLMKNQANKNKNFESSERNEGDRRSHERSSDDSKFSPPNSEVLEMSKKRRHSRDYILKILKETDICKKNGEIGVILRREGLYSSQLSTWRKKRENGEYDATHIKNHNKIKMDKIELEKENVILKKRKRKLEKKLKKAELIIEFQKKISQILEIPLKKKRKKR